MFKYVFLAFAMASLSSMANALDCPSEEEMHPCQCVTIVNYIRCDGGNVTSGEQITQVLDRVSSLFEEDFVFQSFFMVDTNVEELPAGVIKSLKFREIGIRNNPKLKYISPDAFTGTKNTVEYLNVQHVNFSQSGSSDWVFEFLNNLPSISEIVMLDVGIDSIPDNAFDYNPNLAVVKISQNALKAIGDYPFSKLINLTTLWLDNSNGLIPDAISPNAFRNLSSTVSWVALDWTDSLEYLPEASIRPIFDTVGRLTVGGEECIVFPICGIFKRFLCDHNIDWICSHPNRAILEGYHCSNTLFDKIEGYCAWTHPNTTTSNPQLL